MKNICFIAVLCAIVLSTFTSCEDGSKPTANFDYTPSSPKAGQTVKFTNTSVNAYYYHWDFGNGSTSELTQPTEVFSAGTWTVSLTAYNSDYTKLHTISKVIYVAPQPTTVRLTSYTVNSIDFEDENGRYWDDSSKDGPDIYMRIYEGEKEIHRSKYRKDNVTASDLPFTLNLDFTLDDLYKTYTLKLCDYDPMLVDYMFSSTFTPSNFTDEYPTTVYTRNGKFDIELHLEWK